MSPLSLFITDLLPIEGLSVNIVIDNAKTDAIPITIMNQEEEEEHSKANDRWTPTLRSRKLPISELSLVNVVKISSGESNGRTSKCDINDLAKKSLVVTADNCGTSSTTKRSSTGTADILLKRRFLTKRTSLPSLSLNSERNAEWGGRTTDMPVACPKRQKSVDSLKKLL